MNMFGIVVHNISDCLQTAADLGPLIELENGKRIRYHRTEFGRNLV